jgi:hypothetical protein
MRQLLYVSNCARDFAHDALEAILSVSRRNNGAVGLTGMLLNMDGAFLQVLEGDHDTVERTYARICEDDRHWGAQVLIDQDAPRAFGQWSMGFERLGPGRLDADHAFRISQEAVAAKLDLMAPIEIRVLLRNFHRVNDGQTLSA